MCTIILKEVAPLKLVCNMVADLRTTGNMTSLPPPQVAKCFLTHRKELDLSGEKTDGKVWEFFSLLQFSRVQVRLDNLYLYF